MARGEGFSGAATGESFLAMIVGALDARVGGVRGTRLEACSDCFSGTGDGAGNRETGIVSSRGADADRIG